MRGRSIAALLFGVVAMAGPRGVHESGPAVVLVPRRVCVIPPNRTPAETRQNRLNAFNDAAAVFTAKVIELTRVTVRMEVDRVWKGEAKKNITLLTGQPPDPNVWVEETFEFAAGRSYLVFAYKEASGELTTNMCTRTALLDRSQDEVRALEEIVRSTVIK